MASYGTRAVGDVIPGIGTIDQVSLTAYRVGTSWVPFSKVDDWAWAEPLIQDAGIRALVSVMKGA